MLAVTSEVNHKVILSSCENLHASDSESVMDCSFNIASDTMTTGSVKDFKSLDRINTEMFQDNDKEIMSKSDDLAQTRDNQRLISESRSPKHTKGKPSSRQKPPAGEMLRINHYDTLLQKAHVLYTLESMSSTGYNNPFKFWSQTHTAIAKSLASFNLNFITDHLPSSVSDSKGCDKKANPFKKTLTVAEYMSRKRAKGMPRKPSKTQKFQPNILNQQCKNREDRAPEEGTGTELKDPQEEEDLNEKIIDLPDAYRDEDSWYKEEGEISDSDSD